MKLYELNTEITAIESKMMAFAEEHEGDVSGFELQGELDKLEGAREDKIINLALWYKNCASDEKAIAVERKNLQARENTLKNRQEWLKTVLTHEVKEGEKLKDTRVSISWKASEAVEITVAPEALPAQYLRKKVTIEADKKPIMEALKSGIEIVGAKIVNRNNIQVK